MNKSHILSTIKLILFILIVSLFIDKVVYYTITKISENVYSGQAVGKLNQYLTIKDTTKTIVFGSSRANHHIDIRKLTRSSYNIGIDGKFIAYSAILIKMLPKDTHQNVLLHVDPDIGFRSTYSREEIKSLMAKYHSNDIINEELKRAEKNTVFQEFYWCIDYNGSFLGIIKNAIFPKYNPVGYYGYDPIKLTKTEIDMFKKILARGRLTYSACGDELKFNETYLEYLLEIIAFCKTNNKNLIVITSPLYKDLCPGDNVILADLLKENNIKYYDYTNFYNKSNKLEYWKDYAHLSDVGAEIFSEELSKDLTFYDK